MKPKICGLLGVGLNEEFLFFNDIYRIAPICTPIMKSLFEESGKETCVGYNLQRKQQNSWCNGSGADVIELLDHADLIERNEV